jgi:hypothetical protein
MLQSSCLCSADTQALFSPSYSPSPSSHPRSPARPPALSRHIWHAGAQGVALCGPTPCLSQSREPRAHARRAARRSRQARVRRRRVCKTCRADSFTSAEIFFRSGLPLLVVGDVGDRKPAREVSAGGWCRLAALDPGFLGRCECVHTTLLKSLCVLYSTLHAAAPKEL